MCDGLADGAAWGLCNAYCEAMDCDGTPKASDQACQHVLENFVAQDAGPIPCGCPCFDETDLDDVVARCDAPVFSPILCQTLPAEPVIFCGGNVTNFLALAEEPPLPGFPGQCSLIDFDGDPFVLLGNLRPDELTACIGLIEAKQSEGVCDIGP